MHNEGTIKYMLDMSPEQLAEVQRDTNALLRTQLVENLARLDAGANVEAFTFGVAYRNEGDDPDAVITMGGESRPALGLIDVQQFGMIKNALRAGLLTPATPERLMAVKSSGYVNPVDILGVVLEVGRVIEERKSEEAVEQAANEASSVIKRASAA